jgi:hypothetical protein
VSGVESDRLGVVMVALLNVIAIFAAASAMIEVARPLATRNDDRRRFIRVQAAGIAMVVVLMMVAFAVAGQYIANGYADMLWSSAAVGAVVYGLVLPQEPSNMYVALILAVVAGLTKLEGSFTGAVIIGLVVMRMVLHNRTSEHRRPWTQLLTPALSAWLVIAAWPIVIHILGARPDMPMDGVRMGNDVTRLHASLLGAWGQLHLLALAVPVAVVSALCLKRARQMAGLGNDLWIWVAIAAELIVVMTAYVVGPGNIAAWLNVTIFRITIFPTLLLWWLMATWAIIGVSEVRWVQDSNSSEAKVPTEP